MSVKEEILFSCGKPSWDSCAAEVAGSTYREFKAPKYIKLTESSMKMSYLMYLKSVSDSSLFDPNWHGSDDHGEGLTDSYLALVFNKVIILQLY